MEITDEQVIWCILNHLPKLSNDEKKILSILNDNLSIGRENIANVENYCCNQGWIAAIHHVETKGDMDRTYHTVEATASGRRQVGILWKRCGMKKKVSFEIRHPRWNRFLWLIATALVTALVAAIVNAVMILVCKS